MRKCHWPSDLSIISSVQMGQHDQERSIRASGRKLLSDEEIEPSEIQICRSEGGEECKLGEGGFGSVSLSRSFESEPLVILLHDRSLRRNSVRGQWDVRRPGASDVKTRQVTMLESFREFSRSQKPAVKHVQYLPRCGADDGDLIDGK